jgi:hypothetical protein
MKKSIERNKFKRLAIAFLAVVMTLGTVSLDALAMEEVSTYYQDFKESQLDGELIEIVIYSGSSETVLVNAVLPTNSYQVGRTFPLHSQDRVQFNFHNLTQHFRVGMTNNRTRSGARWASTPSSTLVIPSAGQWSFIIENISSIPIAGTFSGSYTVTSAHAFSAELSEVKDVFGYKEDLLAGNSILSIGGSTSTERAGTLIERSEFEIVHQDDNATKLHINEHFISPLSGTNHWVGITEEGVSFVATDATYVGSGITECGLDFRVYKPSETSNVTTHQIGGSQYVRRTVWFQGNVVPPSTILWSESIGGITWGGTLRLFGGHYHSWRGETEAIYSGMIWSAN